MMRATPYCSVSPMATSAYMPPKVTPESVTSNSMYPHSLLGARHSVALFTSSMMRHGEARSQQRSVLPGGLGHHGRADAGALRRHASEEAVLPLADQPEIVLHHVVDKLHLAQHGVEGAGLQLL